VTFLADGTYYNTEEEDDAPFDYDGMERGTYTWNPTTGLLTAIPDIDTNGADGLSDLPPGFTATISGNAMTVPDDDEDTPLTLETAVLRRITPITAPLNVAPDFEVDKFSNYQQTSAANPSLLPVPGPLGGDYPFWGEAYIEDTVSGTAGTLTIASQAARPFINDEGWGIETAYSTLNALNGTNAFPNNANYVLARTGGSATLSFPTGGTFPPAPKITRDDIIADATNEDGAWIAGEYVLAQNQTLIWDAHANYNPATHVTVLSVVDQGTGEELFNETVIQGYITSYDFSGKLTPGTSYDVQLEHVKIASSTQTGTGPFAGKLGYAFYNSNTRFTMVAPEQPIFEPAITQQPLSQLPAPGDLVTLSVGTDGVDLSLTYQWFKDAEPIPGQTGNSLSIGDYSNAADGGTYTVQVSNAAGSDTSNPATLGPPTVKSITLSKDIEYIQTGPSTVIVNPEGITAAHGGTYGFFTEVKGINLALITAPTVTPPAGTLGFQNILQYNADDLLWGYGFNGGEFNTDTQALIDSKFPNGTYTFLANGASVPLSLPGNSFYPNTPQFTLSGGTWVNGKYAMDAANTLTITTNVFAQYSSNVDGRISLRVNDELKQELFASSSPSNNFASYTVTADTFETYEVNEIGADFDAVTSKSNAIPGAFAAAYYTKSLFLNVYILPKITTQSSSQVLPPNTPVNLQVSASGSPATISGTLNYQWKKNGVIIPDEIFTNLFVFSSSADIAGNYTCTVSNDVGAVTSEPILLEYADEFQAYAASYGLNSVTTGAPDADFDHDGIPNLLEYLFGGNPTLPNGGLQPTITKAPGSNNLVFTYKRKIAATGVTQVIEHSTSVSPPWTPAVHGQNGVTIITSPLDAETEQVTTSIPSTSPSRFVRLKVLR
jgi:hypothetical protein